MLFILHHLIKIVNFPQTLTNLANPNINKSKGLWFALGEPLSNFKLVTFQDNHTVIKWAPVA